MLQHKQRIGAFVNIHWCVSPCVDTRAKYLHSGAAPANPHPVAPPPLTIVVSVQTPECQPQLLLVLLQVFGELVEVETPILVLVPGRHDLLQRGEIKSNG